MKELMSKMMDKEDGSSDDSHDKAKMEVLEELREMAMSLMGDKMKSKIAPSEMKEVTVAAPDKAGLTAGLDMAKEVIPDMEAEEDEEDMDIDEIDAMIRDLEEKKRAKLGQV